MSIDFGILERDRLFNLSLDMLCIITFDGNFKQLNPAWEKTLGIPLPDLRAKAFLEIIHPEDKALTTDQMHRLMNELDTAAFENRGVCRDGSFKWLAWNASSLPQRQLIYAVVRDITEQKRAEQAQRILADAGKLLAASPDYSTRVSNVAQLAVPEFADWCAVDMVEGDQTIRRVAIVHADPNKMELVRELTESYPSDPNAMRGVANVLRTGEAEIYSVIDETQMENTARTDAQYAIWRKLGLRSAVLVPLRAHGRTLGAITFAYAESKRHYATTDLALAEELARRAALSIDNARLYAEAQQLNIELEQRVLQRTTQLLATNQQLIKSQERLRRLSAHLQDAREEERTRIAREIHDELGQMLTGLKMDLAWLQSRLPDDKKTWMEKTRAMSDLIDATIQTVRRISTELRPGLLDDLGLVAALEWQTQEFERRTGIRCKITTELHDLALDSARATAVFRIFQETLTNVARHANATSAKVTLKTSRGKLILEVKDNGRGITESELNDAKSLGILGIRERAALLSGQVAIIGRKGKGTTVTVKIPLKTKTIGAKR